MMTFNLNILIFGLFTLFMTFDSNTLFIFGNLIAYTVILVVLIISLVLATKNSWRDYIMSKNLDFILRILILESSIATDNIRYASDLFNQCRFVTSIGKSTSILNQTLLYYSTESNETSKLYGTDTTTSDSKTLDFKMKSHWTYFRYWDYYRPYYTPVTEVYTMDDFTRTYTKAELISKFYKCIDMLNESGRTFEERYNAALVIFEANRNVFLMRYNKELRDKQCYYYGTVETSDLLETLIPGWDIIRNQNIENRNSIQRQLNEHRARRHPEIEDVSPSASYHHELREMRKNQSCKFKDCGSCTRDMCE